MARGLAVILAGSALPLLSGALPARAAEVYPAPASGSWAVSGHGFGHGRGMSQWGAYGAATRGLGWQQILSFYYPGTTATSIGTPTVRVRLTADPTQVRVAAAAGLAVVDAAGRTTGLPGDRDQWRVVPSGGGVQLQGHTAAGWAAYPLAGATTVAAPLRFQSTARVERVYRADGSSVDYRGVVAAYVSGASMTTVLSLPLEQYLWGTVPRESPASWPTAALSAQAVAARTYAYSAMTRAAAGSTYDLCDSTSCQVFGGSVLHSASGATTNLEYASSNAAVTATTGVVLTSGGRPAFTEYSSSNGGWTVAGSAPYLPAQADPYDGAAPGDPVHSWSDTISTSSLERAFPSVGRVTQLVVTSRDGRGDWGGRVLGATVVGTAGSVATSGDAIASAAGLYSSWFTVSDQPPFGRIDGVTAQGGRSVTAVGWAIDPSTTAPLSVTLTSDGTPIAAGTASLSRPDVGAAYPASGSVHGYSLTGAVTSGTPVLCLVATNVGSSGAYPQTVACRRVVGPGVQVPSQLLPGQSVVAPWSGDRLVMQGDGNLVLYDAAGHALWATMTFVPGTWLLLQGDGNAVLYAPSGGPVWATMTFGTAPRLVAQDDGNVVLYTSKGALWDRLGFTGHPPRRFVP